MIKKLCIILIQRVVEYKKKRRTQKARKKFAKCGVGLCVNGDCHFSNNMYVGDYCNFNGMYVNGNGKVVIGNYFHSGIECMLITQNHNYEGTQIPYDSTYIKKEINIGDFVWFGNRVTVMGGQKLVKAQL